MTQKFTGQALAALALCVFTAAGTTQAQPGGPPGSGGGKIVYPGNAGPPDFPGGGSKISDKRRSDRNRDKDRDRDRGRDRDRRRDSDRNRDDWGGVAVPLALGAAALALSASQTPVYAAPAYPVAGPINPVAAIQMRLNSLGYNAGRPDGVYGAGTRRAVAQFQANNGLVPDGIAGPATQAHLARMGGY